MPNSSAPWWALYTLAGFVLAIFAGAIVAAYLTGNKELASNLSIAAATAATGVLAFFFGSSQGSQKKDETIAASTAALAQSAPVITQPATQETRP